MKILSLLLSTLNAAFLAVPVVALLPTAMLFVAPGTPANLKLFFKDERLFSRH